MDESRFILYDKITSLLNANIPSNKILCIEKYKKKNLFMLFSTRKKYVLNKKIILCENNINKSSSVYGSIYLSYINDDNSNTSYYFITKVGILTNITINELVILNKVSQNVLETKNIHLPLIYNNVKCDNIDTSIINLKIIKEQDEFNNATSYYSFFIEKEEGDIYTLLKDYKYNGYYNIIILNIISQVFMGILSCHSLNIYHNDAHPGNFLFKPLKISKPSCVEYKYKDLTFYIENMGYIIKIVDFGLSRIEKRGIELIDDYITFIESILKINLIINKNLLKICKGNIDVYFTKEEREKNTIYNHDDDNMLNILNKIKSNYYETYYNNYYGTDYDIDYDIDYEFIKYLINIGILSKIPIGTIIQTIDLNENMS